MNQQAKSAIAVLDEMIQENIRDNKIFFDEGHKIPEFHKSEKEILEKAKSRIQELDDMSNNGWIPVTERLPEEHSDILVYYYGNRNSKFFPECQYMKQTSYYNDRFECEEEVTHWMNLPDSPK